MVLSRDFSASSESFGYLYMCMHVHLNTRAHTQDPAHTHTHTHNTHNTHTHTHTHTHTPCLSPSNNSKERFDLKNINIVKIKQPTNLYKVSFKGTKLAILGALRCSRPLSTSPSSPRPARHRRQISSMRALDWSMMCRAVVPCRHRGHLAAIHLSSTNLAAIHLSSTLPSVLHLSGGETRGVAVGRPPGVGRVPGAHQDLGDRLTGCPVPSRWEGGLSAGSKHGGAFCRYSASGARSARAQPEPLASGASARVPSS